jgi:glycosylphosphatidylinositol transamidase (GPIT) subunit GPI8
MDKRTGTRLTRNCIVTGSDLTIDDLTAPVIELYLIMTKLFPVVNSQLTGHWSVIAKTPKGYFNISTARYMSIYIYRVTKENMFCFKSNRWEDKLYVLKKYQLNDNYKDKPVTIYDIAKHAMDFYNKNDKMKYSLIDNNCQHVAQYIVSTYGKVDKDDKLLNNLKGLRLLYHSITDAVHGPKIMF